MAHRKAKGSNGVERDWMPAEKYQLYARGFRDGAATRAMIDEHNVEASYERGYADGRVAVATAVDAYAKEIGYVPTILRTNALPAKAGGAR